jgi:hypothetical protein
MRISTQIAIVDHFKVQPPQTYTRRSLALTLTQNREQWKAPKSLTVDQLITILLENDQLEVAELSSTEYGTKTRYTLGAPSPFQLASSFYKNSFLSHGSALFLHGLASLDAIYVNHEQSVKRSTTTLTQGALDRAFRNEQRQSNYIFNYSSHNIVFLNGKNTGCAGVTEMKGPQNEILRVSDLERTLIDITVRPRYAGSLRIVAGAFQKAALRVSISRVADLLELTAYSYPYHQALGFLLQRAGVPQDQLIPLKNKGIRFKFYLDYGMTNPVYDPVWNIYYPNDLPGIDSKTKC